MKFKNIYTTLCLAAFAMVSCSKNDLELPEETVPGLPIKIMVIDGGYASADDHRAEEDAPATRTVENGYTTVFTAGDTCGLYIVRGGEVIEANIKLTASAESDGTDGVEWSAEEPLWHAPGDTYYLYYPWQEAPQGVPAVGDAAAAGDDVAFFSGLIAAWRPASDQSNYADYAASDLMTAYAETGTATLSFSMTHRMALAVVALPITVYEFTNTDPAIPGYTIAPAVQFGADALPYAFSGGTYRYLVNPAKGAVLSAVYNDGQQHEFDIEIAPNHLVGGSYKTYKVDGAATVQKKHNLQIGDFFLADGNLLSKDADAVEVQASDVVGIVFQTDPNRIGQAEKDALMAKGVNEPHGLVMSVRNAASKVYWGSSDTDEGLKKCGSKAQNYKDISGYGNCEHIRASRGSFDAYPAFREADEYNAVCPVSAATTGWYLPASGQWWDIMQNLGNSPALANPGEQTSPDVSYFNWSDQGDVCAALNSRMASIADKDKDAFVGGSQFWSSSEDSYLNARYWGVYTNNPVNVGCYWSRKIDHAYYGVRTVLAF